MFLKIVDISEKQLCEALRKRVNALQYYENVLPLIVEKDSSLISLYYILVQATLFSDFGVSLKELKDSMKISYNTINKYLKTIPEGILVKQMQNRIMYCSLNLNEFDKYIDSKNQ